jgi:hypothetical protein
MGKSKYVVIDTQAGYFMVDTIDEPMTKEDLVDRFWCLDECRTNSKKDFTFDYIMEMWNLEIVDHRIYLLEQYDEYMTEKVESEGYCLPISLKAFLDFQVNPVALYELDLEKTKDLRFFERVKDLYLKHTIEVMDGTELSNTPVCYAEWLENEAMEVQNADV